MRVHLPSPANVRSHRLVGVAAAMTFVMVLAACSSDADAGDTADENSTAGQSTAAPTTTPRSTTGDTSLHRIDVTVTGTVATDFTTPWGLGFLPDGTALVTERDTATIKAVGPGADHPVRTVGVIEGVHPGGEGGLLGLAVSPAFTTDHTIFVYYTAADDNRIAAVTVSSDVGSIVGSRDIVTGIPAASVHNGGRLLMADDGTLFASTGDATDGANAQDLGSLGGKILHLTTEGDGAPGNPFPQAPLVYSYGHRNVQGLAFDSEGRLWASEFGASSYDELNLIQPGGNYGWPEVEGPSTDPDFIAPRQYWPTDQASPSGLAIVDDVALMAALRGSRLWVIPLSGPPGASTPTAVLSDRYGRLRTVAVAPDGSVWLTTSNTDGRGTVRPGDDRILRLAVS